MPEGTKINSASYCNLLEEFLLPWIGNQSDDVRSQLIFQHDNAPSHSTCFTKKWLEDRGFVGDSLMQWPPRCPDLNPIEHLRELIKRRVYKNGCQYNTTDDLWNAIKNASTTINSKKLTSNVKRSCSTS